MSTPRPPTRFVPREDGSLRGVLASAGLDDEEAAGAVSEGRVFVGRTRARALDEPVVAMHEVTIHPRRATVPLPEPFVLHRQQGVLVVDKPAGIPTVPDLVGAHGALLDEASRAVSLPASSLHPTSRLDLEVSGVVTFATDARAAAKLASAREAGRYRRLYVAIASGSLEVERARWTWAIARDRDPRRRKAIDGEATDAKPSASRVVLVAHSTVGSATHSVLALAPETGRTHQLRVHAARAGLPLLGDALYGGPRRITSDKGSVRTLDRVALHCARVQIDLGDCIVDASSPVPPGMRALATALGFAEDVFEKALQCTP